VVFAAASLRDAFSALGEDFKRAHAGVEIAFNFAGTQELRTQLEHGAAVDVFASADQKHMQALLDAQRVQAPRLFARNEPVIVVTPGGPALQGLADLPKAKRLVIGTPEVPIGRYTLQIFDKAKATLGEDFPQRAQARVVSRELNVRQVLAKVSLGEADAGIVYRSDAKGAESKVTVVTIESGFNVIAEYPIAVVSGAAHPRLAQAWVDLTLSAGGQQVLQYHGFQAGVSEPSP
jgi:molybdate transport system substrate-binding protein